MDSFKAVYRILSALEKAMDLPAFDVQQIGHEALGVTQERWCRYMGMMADVGYIKGVEIQRFITGETSVDAPRHSDHAQRLGVPAGEQHHAEAL